LRIVAVGAALVTLAVMLPWEPLTGGIAEGSVYLPEDRWAVAGSAVILASLWLILLRVRVEGYPDRVRVRGPLRDITLAWSAVDSVRYSGASPFAALQLTNSEPVPMVALTRFDGQRAVDDIRALRALHRAYQETAARR